MKKGYLILLALMLLIPITVQAQRLAVGVKAGTLGPGIDVSFGVINMLSVRVGGTYLPVSFTETIDDEDVTVEFTADNVIGAASALLDFHPFGGMFRLTGGFFYNMIEIDGSGRPLESYFMEDKEFTPDRLGSLSVNASYENTISPYLGLGFGNAIGGSRLTFMVDLGMLYAGSPVIDMTGTGMIRGTADFDTILNEGIESFQWYPNISMGLSFRVK